MILSELNDSLRNELLDKYAGFEDLIDQADLLRKKMDKLVDWADEVSHTGSEFFEKYGFDPEQEVDDHDAENLIEMASAMGRNLSESSSIEESLDEVLDRVVDLTGSLELSFDDFEDAAVDIKKNLRSE